MPFTAHTAAKFPRNSSYQLLSPSHFPVRQAYKPVRILFTSQFYKWRAAIWESLHLHVAANRGIRHSYTTLRFIMLHSVWQVRLLLVDVKATHKAKPRSSAQLLRMLHQPAFISLHYTSFRFFIPHPSLFATPQQPTCMVTCFTATTPHFGSPDTCLHTTFVTVSGKHEIPLNVKHFTIQASC